MNHNAVIKRKNKVVKVLVSGIRAQLKRSNVNVVEGYARIDGKSSDGYIVMVNDETYTAKRLLIATGSAPVIPSIPGVTEGLEAGYVLTNREIL